MAVVSDRQGAEYAHLIVDAFDRNKCFPKGVRLGDVCLPLEAQPAKTRKILFVMRACISWW